MRTSYAPYFEGLRLEHVCFSVGEKTLVDGVSLEVRPGEVVALIGANGAGKTTALRLAAGDLTPSAGSVKLDGRPLDAHPAGSLALRRAVLSQRPTLSFDFTVTEVVLLGRTPHRTHRNVDLAAAHSAMATMGVSDLCERRYTTLSGGEQQRVQMARVLAQLAEPDAHALRHRESRYLLLDEPTTALDIAHQQQLLRTARASAQAGLGVLVVMHDLNLTAQYADRVVVLHAGRVIDSGTPWEVLTPPTIRHAFDIEVVVGAHPTDASLPLIVPTTEALLQTMA